MSKATSCINIFILFILLALVSVNANAGSRDWIGRKIQKIKITGNKKIEKDAILDKIALKAGDKLDRKTVKKVISAVYKMGFFDDVEINYETAGSVLEFSVKERPSIVKIEFEGNSQLSDDELKDVIKIKEYEIFNPEKVQDDIREMSQHYEEKGYYLAKISYETIKQEKPDQIKLVYKIRDFDKVRVRKITFLNNTVFTDRQLKAAFRITKETNFWSWLTDRGNYRETALKADFQALTYFYFDHGYIRFRHDPPVVTVTEDKQWVFVTLRLHEGERYKLGDIDFSGDLLFTKDELHKRLQLKKDDVFSISKRNIDITRLQEMYQDKGYAFVNVIPRLDINDKTKIVNINYNFEKGKLVHFGKITVTGNTKTRDKVIRRELRIKEGELFNGTRLRKSRENVERLGYFAPGEVVFNTKPPANHADDVLDVIIDIKERSTGTFTLGMGYSTVAGLYFTSQVSEINLFGRGQVLSFSANMNTKGSESQYSVGFTEPYFLDSNWSLGGDIFRSKSFVPGRFDERKIGFNIRVGHPVAEYTKLFMTYKFEDMKLTNVYDPDVDIELEAGLLSSIVTTIERDRRNNRFEPTRGSYQSLSFEYAGLGGEKYFGKARGSTRWYTPVIGDLIYRANFEVGGLFRTRTGRRGDIPSSEKYYLGSPNNLKGYRAFSVSPKSPTTGKSVGGTFMAFTSHELEYPLIREAGIKWVMFFDAGNSWDGLPDTQGLSIKTDAGFGFRWFSPIGPLRFEWGFPLNKKPGDDDFNFNFFIGPPF